jgi:hypothetical protein
LQEKEVAVFETADCQPVMLFFPSPEEVSDAVRLREGGQRPGEGFFKTTAKLQTSSVICHLFSGLWHGRLQVPDCQLLTANCILLNPYSLIA